MSVAQQALMGQGLIIEASRSHLRHNIIGGTSLDEWSARRRDLCLTTHNTHNRHTSFLPGGIRTHNPSKLAAADPRRRPHGHEDRRRVVTYFNANLFWLFNLINLKFSDSECDSLPRECNWTLSTHSECFVWMVMEFSRLKVDKVVCLCEGV